MKLHGDQSNQSCLFSSKLLCLPYKPNQKPCAFLWLPSATSLILSLFVFFSKVFFDFCFLHTTQTYPDLNSLLSHSAALILLSLLSCSHCLLPPTACCLMLWWDTLLMTCHSSLLVPYAKSFSLIIRCYLLVTQPKCVKFILLCLIYIIYIVFLL